ncbi:beta-ketoacyl-[acyl-carrier-protein] synthase family protein [Ideonella azotifigens]|uniref:Beta-ketoacyl-[acyl-carrier-protein] synthase family protein n=2 Tax=Ideonella azotifigens TaxID=513160 RepID=A0ABN1K015_9BURK|nr:beta-ketoacyl-[acyl-carrier-protein] synthase family protein [Ideonella azotifigens]MCD2342607.1 beta-ketoacyl-[acyl-carrier-protein] synthase family protein [Ideonella azotifigens]
MAHSPPPSGRVVITGIGPVTPIGSGRHEFWRAAAAGRNGVVDVASTGALGAHDALRSRIVACLPEAALPGVGHGDQRLSAMCMRAFELACDDAGPLDGHAADQIGVVMGTAVGTTAAMERSFLKMAGTDAGATPFDLMEQVSFHTVAHAMARRLRAHGPVLTVSTGCTAGIDAIGMAFDLVRHGSCGVVLAGAGEAPVCPVVYAAFDSIGALSTRNDDPASASRPFAKDRDGFVLGEGACMLVVEDYERARARGARIYAELLGFASVSNAFHMTDLPPDGAALARCMSLGLADAALKPEAIDAVNAHGSSTPQNDICETNAIKAVLGQRKARQVPVNSLKSMVGHALGASNAIEIAACAMAIQEQYMFPTINFGSAGDGCDLDYVPNQGRGAPIGALLKLSSGFSGVHSALVMGHPQR